MLLLVLALLFIDGVGDNGFNGDETVGENVWRYGGANGDIGSLEGTGSSLIDLNESVETLAGVEGPSMMGVLLLAVSRKAAEATSALRAVDDRPYCCKPSSSPLGPPASLDPAAALGKSDILQLPIPIDLEDTPELKRAWWATFNTCDQYYIRRSMRLL